MVAANQLDSRLQLTFYNGVDPDSGKDLFKSKTFNNVKTTATNEQLFVIAQALVPLQELSLSTVKRNDSTLLTEE
ncbi:DUF1659 domain-containing protein [Gracilibacillus alcaliphilus]|uniref:DUF1659 domain-containing protein n=1 Tax=Gracilibacillus alcaliphilus TaxID=1401441 RepID=UPI00195BE459|nr:DUF1659 domain-containing protein [Gracilibacillus alcaliphilus]MBM7678433.1 hypothetical protein [Gracilibacillus alcaliphilus]